MKRIYPIFIVVGIILSIQSCDPDFGIGVKNNSNSPIKVITILPYHDNKDTTKVTKSILPGDFAILSSTGGMYGIDTSDFMFNQIQIIRNKDTLSVNGGANILRLFVKDPSGAYFIVIDDKTNFPKTHSGH